MDSSLQRLVKPTWYISAVRLSFGLDPPESQPKTETRLLGHREAPKKDVEISQANDITALIWFQRCQDKYRLFWPKQWLTLFNWFAAKLRGTLLLRVLFIGQFWLDGHRWPLSTVKGHYSDPCFPSFLSETLIRRYVLVIDQQHVLHLNLECLKFINRQSQPHVARWNAA